MFKFLPISLVVLICFTTDVLAQEPEAIFLRELRRLQLFPEAERYCQQQLARGDLSSASEVDFTIEHIRTLAMHALASSAAEREMLWSNARSLAKTFSTKHPTHPRLALIQVQDALTLQAMGDQQRREAEALSEPASQLVVASTSLRSAENMLANIAQALTKEITQRRNQPAKANELTLEELTRLKLQAEWQQAKTTWSRAYCYAAESRDRKALLLSTLEKIEATVGRINANDEMAGQLRVLQMACLRELKRYDEALQAWELINRDDIALVVRREALAEAMRVKAWSAEPLEALKWLEDAKYLPLLQTRDPELELAKLEVVMRLAQLAAEKKNAAELTQWQRTAAQLATQIERVHGSYWEHRADQLLASLAGGSSTAADASVDLLARQADANYLQRKYDEAQQLYEQAAQASHTAGQADREFELRYKSALVAQERRQFDIAAARLERLAIAFKEHAKAAEAHLVACWNKAQQAREQKEAAAAYGAMLEEHVSRWPHSKSADQANLWLGNWRQSQAQFATAFNAYAAVRKDSPHFTAALSGASACAKNELARLAEAGKATEAVAREYVEYFRLTLPDKASSSISDEERIATLAAAEILVQYIPSGCSAAEAMLIAILKSADENAVWRIDAQSLYIVSLAGQSGRTAEAAKQLQASSATSAQLLSMLDRLSIIAARSPTAQRSAIANVQVAVLQKLETTDTQLSESQKLDLKRTRAAILALTGDRAAALAAYEQLARDEPKNGNVQEAYAELLSAGKDATSLKNALDKWRQIAKNSKPREERWYKAKFQVASLLVRLDKKTDAATLIKFLLETPPGVTSESWKVRFEVLLEQCEK